MAMDPILSFRSKSFDVEDMALAFVEEELGRHDWKNNWRTAKVAGTALPRIRSWLRSLGYEAEPQEVFNAIKNLYLDRTGRWR